jgi:hypothetical protein
VVKDYLEVFWPLVSSSQYVPVCSTATKAKFQFAEGVPRLMCPSCLAVADTHGAWLLLQAVAATNLRSMAYGPWLDNFVVRIVASAANCGFR